MTKVYDLNKLPWNSALSVVGNAVVIDLGGCVNKFAWMTTPFRGCLTLILSMRVGLMILCTVAVYCLMPILAHLAQPCVALN